MKELIKEAERLYIDIDETQSHLIKARLDKDRIREHLELIGLETIVFDVKQFLKCIIDRKDNIVDLGKVWHEIKEEPEYGNPIVYVTKLNKIGTLKRVDNHRLSWYIDKYAICKWAYLKDLMPKGDR